LPPTFEISQGISDDEETLEVQQKQEIFPPQVVEQ
jgi:hypothetical protein